MKKVKRGIVLLLIAGSVLAACNNGPKEKETGSRVGENSEQMHQDSTNVHDHHGDVAMDAYQCPMECEGDKTYAEKGTCPVCHMNLAMVETTSDSESGEENH